MCHSVSAVRESVSDDVITGVIPDLFSCFLNSRKVEIQQEEKTGKKFQQTLMGISLSHRTGVPPEQTRDTLIHVHGTGLHVKDTGSSDDAC